MDLLGGEGNVNLPQLGGLQLGNPVDELLYVLNRVFIESLQSGALVGAKYHKALVGREVFEPLKLLLDSLPRVGGVHGGETLVGLVTELNTTNHLKDS